VKTKFSADADNTIGYYDSAFNSDDYGVVRPIEDFAWDNESDSPQHNSDNYNRLNRRLEPSSKFTYEPETYNFLPPEDSSTLRKTADTISSTKNPTVRAIASIGVISAGLYAILRSMGKRR